jgi:hypothetical protein
MLKSILKRSRVASMFLTIMLGATIWAGKAEALRWELGRNDVYSSGGSLCSRMPIGKRIFKTSTEQLNNGRKIIHINLQEGETVRLLNKAKYKRSG